MDIDKICLEYELLRYKHAVLDALSTTKEVNLACASQDDALVFLASIPFIPKFGINSASNENKDLKGQVMNEVKDNSLKGNQDAIKRLHELKAKEVELADVSRCNIEVTIMKR